MPKNTSILFETRYQDSRKDYLSSSRAITLPEPVSSGLVPGQLFAFEK